MPSKDVKEAATADDKRKRCVDCQCVVQHGGPEIVCLRCLVDAIANHPKKGGADWAFKKLLQAMQRSDLMAKAIGLARAHFPARWRAHSQRRPIERRLVPSKPPPPPLAEPKHTRGKTMATNQRDCEKCGVEFPGSGKQRECDECILKAMELGERPDTWVRRLEGLARRSPKLRKRALAVVVKAAQKSKRIKVPDSLRPTVRTFDDIDKVAKKHTRKKARQRTRKKARKKPARKKATKTTGTRVFHESNLADAVPGDSQGNGFDEELAAMATVHKALDPLVNASRERVIRYVFDRLGFSL